MSPVPGGRARHSRILRLLVLVFVAIAVLVALVWFVRREPAEPPGRIDLGALPPGVSRDRLNLVIVTLDTTRADRIGAYGARNVETKALDRIASEGILFEQAVAVAPLTLPAHSSIFTGKFPPEHGVRDNGGFFLGSEQVTLAEVLKQRGYRTGAFVGAYVLDSKWGLDQGFDAYADDFEIGPTRGASLSGTQRPANEVLDKALPWITDAGGAPFFAWLHFYDPHAPYRAPEPYGSRYKDHPYNGEIAFTDSQVSRLISHLESLGAYDRTILVVMGDHGESLGDHGESAHGFFIYNSVTHVPFLMRTPFSATRGRRVSDPVRAVDLMPTVLDLMGVAAPERTSGTSLVPLVTGAATELELEAYSEAMYPLHHYGWSDLRALRAGRYKVIDAPRPELYDVDRDPQESTNLYPERRTLAERMLAQLRTLEEQFNKTTASMPAADVDPEARERLAALGYVGSFVASASDPRTARADPKDKIALFNKLGEAQELSRDAEPSDRAAFSKVVALLDDVVRQDPQVIDAWFMLGTQHLRRGDAAKAVEYFQRTLQLKPDYDLAVINLANAYRRLGNDEAALAGFEHYLRIDPKDAFVHYQMGEVWLDRGDLARAERQFSEALQLNPQVVAARNALGVIALKRGDTAAAERLIREALATKPDLRLGHFNLALLAEQRGDVVAAEREYFEELKLHPDNYRAAFNLFRLYEQVGDAEGQLGALKQSITSNPHFAEGYLYLAKFYLDSGTNLEEAATFARKGLEIAPKSPHAALGHYVLADIYNRQGRPREAAEALARARALERKAKQGRNPSGGDPAHSH